MADSLPTQSDWRVDESRPGPRVSQKGGGIVSPKQSEPVRIMIVDHHKLVCEGVRNLLETTGKMRVVGMACSREEAMLVASREQPDLILLELDLGGSSGIDLLQDLRVAAKGAKVIILTGVRDPEQHQRAVILGALGLVLKDQPSEVLVKAIGKICAGEAWLDRKTASFAITRLLEPYAQNKEVAKIAALTHREREVIAAICEGLKNREVGKRLFISEGTVRNHLTSILNKLDLSDRFELLLFCYRYGLAKPPRSH